MSDYEREYLSAVLMDPGTLHAYPVPPSDFASRAHQTILGAMYAIVMRREELHTLSLRVELERTGQLRSAGGDDVVLSLSNRLPANPAAVAARIRELARLRGIGDIASRVKVAVADGDLGAARAIAAEMLAVGGDDEDASIGFGELLARGVEATVKGLEKSDHARLGTPTLDADYRPGPGHIVVVGARQNVGKTSLVWAWHISMGKRGIPTGCVSVDDDEGEYGARGLGAVTEINPRRLWNERLSPADFSRVMAGIDRWRDIPIRFRHVRNKSIDRVLGAMHHMVRVHQAQMISIDYVTAIRGRPGLLTRDMHNQTLSEISALASELRVPVILLAQINRGDDEFREPQMKDLAETGNLEQMAQAAILLWRKSDKPGEVTHAKVAKIKRTDRGRRFVLDRDPDTGLLHELTDRPEETHVDTGWS